MTNYELQNILKKLSDASREVNINKIIHGDMPGDKICIEEDHIRKARMLLPLLSDKLIKIAEKQNRIVITVFGGSGVGKSEIASLLGFYFTQIGVENYILSGDNYPHRIPLYNDAERVTVFRTSGIKGLLKSGRYNKDVQDVLAELWSTEKDADPSLCNIYPWLETYQRTGRIALSEYLGTEKELDYTEMNDIISDFRTGCKKIFLKRLGRTEDQRWYDEVDFSNVSVLIIEWTHGGNRRLKGADLRILLNSTPEETREHRRLRARDGKTDSAFTSMVLEIEQEEIMEAADRTDIIVSKSGEITKYIM